MNDIKEYTLLKAYVDMYRRLDPERRYVTEQCLGCIETVLDIVEKQKEKIEELKKPKYIIDCKTNEVTKITNDFISKYKIRKLLDEYKDTGYYELEQVLKELLED